jgi:hypothetical protein
LETFNRFLSTVVCSDGRRQICLFRTMRHSAANNDLNYEFSHLVKSIFIYFIKRKIPFLLLGSSKNSSSKNASSKYLLELSSSSKNTSSKNTSSKYLLELSSSSKNTSSKNTSSKFFSTESYYSEMQTW